MSLSSSYNCTLKASYAGYVVQAIVNNFAPLLFLTFQDTFGISLGMITMLVTVNFGIQLLVDFLSARFVDRIGYRTCIVAAHVFAAAGLAGLAVIPDLMPGHFAGLVVCVCLYAVGGGIIEVLISPIVEACPTSKKDAAMSLLHSFYCWGAVAVVLGSTLFFTVAGVGNWRILALLWAAVPAVNALVFARVPILSLVEDGGGMSIGELAGNRVFWLFAFIFVCAGASEQAMSQWASAFAESGLKVSKTMGDLAGPCMFSLLMGLSRALYARYSEKIRLPVFMTISALLCVFSYLMAAYGPDSVLALLGCGLCGLSVGILWPGAFSLASAGCPRGGTAMFALLALAGDLGCAAGPALVGLVSRAAEGGMKAGLAAAAWIPAVLVFGLCWVMYRERKTGYNQ